MRKKWLKLKNKRKKKKERGNKTQNSELFLLEKSFTPPL
jgi:hypothetical protein